MAIQWPLLIFSVLLGVSSGMFIFLGIGEVKGKFKEVRFLASLIAFICLVVGACVSVLHMGHPLRATHLLGNLGSGLTKELFAVFAMGIIVFVYMLLARKDYPGPSKVSGVLGGIVGVVLSVVAGASYLMSARPAWDSFTLPLMYLGVGIALGFTLMCALVLLKGNAKEEGSFVLKLALCGVLIGVVTTVFYVIWIAVAPHQAPSRSFARLVSGDLALIFWLGVVVIGIIVPVALTALAYAKAKKEEGKALATPSQLSTYLFVAFACTAVGAVALRSVMYLVGTSVEQFIYQ